jgi:hypothetical protein
VVYDLADTNKFICLCTDSFSGDHCEFSKGVQITFALSPDSTLQATDIIASTISYSDYDIKSLRFNVRHQQVYGSLPAHSTLTYSNKLSAYALVTALLKVYRLNYHSEEPEYYVLYFNPLRMNINITVDLTSEDHCPLAQTLWHLVQAIDAPGKLELYSSDLRYGMVQNYIFVHISR